MTPVQVVEVVTVERRTPVLEHPHELAPGQVVGHVLLEHVGHSQPVQRGPERELGVREDDHDVRSLELIVRSFNGVAEGLTRDDVLDNITLFWLTNTGVSAARLYWENKLGFFTPKGVKIPVAASAFPDELLPSPRSWAEKAYPNLIHFNRLDKGGHFAAWEQPKRLTEELRTGFRSLRYPRREGGGRRMLAVLPYRQRQGHRHRPQFIE
jgi:hypothetical protein